MGLQILVVGLAGSGKSTVGRALAIKLGIAYIDGDRLHPQANLDKMAKGTPLSDENRDVWVENIPFNETRAYVQRVAWHALVFAWLDDRKPRDVSSWLSHIESPAVDAALTTTTAP